MQLSPLGRIEQYQPHPGIPAAASPTHGCEPVVWNSASDWETTASQTDALFHAQRGAGQRGPVRKGPLRPTVCQVPLWAPGTQSEQEAPTFQDLTAKPGRPTSPGVIELGLKPRGFGRHSRPLIYLPSPKTRTEHCYASSWAGVPQTLGSVDKFCGVWALSERLCNVCVFIWEFGNNIKNEYKHILYHLDAWLTADYGITKF